MRLAKCAFALLPALGLSSALARGQFGSPIVLSDDIGRPVDQIAVDIDGDGVREIVMSRQLDPNSTENTLSWFSTQTGGASVAPISIATLAQPVRVRAMDVDSDGDQDLVVASSDADRLRWLPNNGSGVFGTYQVIATGATGESWLELADIDGDGLTDVLSSDTMAGELVWYRNRGNGVFSDAKSIASGLLDPEGLAAGDLDGDGDAEVFVALGSTGNFWFVNHGSAGFGERQRLLPTINPGKVLLGDLNGDGDLDVVLARTTTSYVFRNPGDGDLVWTTQAITKADDMALADFDGDGDLDLGWCRFQSSAYGWTKGGTGHSFGQNQPLNPQTENPAFVTPIDLDRDGDPEFLVSQADLFGPTNDNKLLLQYNLHTLGDPYCMAEPNSTGLAGELEATGSSAVDADLMVVTASQLPLSQTGYFLASLTSGFVPLAGGSAGNLCLAGDIGRWTDQVGNTGAAGELQLIPNWSEVPTPSGLVGAMAGEVWHFQCWYRDAAAGSTSNFTEGLTLELQ